jgi:hypothetical protein
MGARCWLVVDIEHLTGTTIILRVSPGGRRAIPTVRYVKGGHAAKSASQPTHTGNANNTLRMPGTTLPSSPQVFHQLPIPDAPCPMAIFNYELQITNYKVCHPKVL